MLIAKFKTIINAVKVLFPVFRNIGMVHSFIIYLHNNNLLMYYRCMESGRK